MSVSRNLLFCLIAVLSLGLGLAGGVDAMGQTGQDPAEVEVSADELSAPTTVSTRDEAMELVEVDWFEESMQGGLTMVALAALSIALVAFIIERAVVLRRRRFAPRSLSDRVFKDLKSKPPSEVADTLQKEKSTLAAVLAYLLRHRHDSKREAVDAAGDLAGRDIGDQEARLTPLSAIAALAPLLGLLGTMIGMIEAFKLVEVFGDEGGASMLAGSISKALITTATGLVIAVPAIVAYYFFKHRLHVMTLEIEAETERVVEVLWPPAASSRAESHERGGSGRDGDGNGDGEVGRRTGSAGTPDEAVPVRASRSGKPASDVGEPKGVVRPGAPTPA